MVKSAWWLRDLQYVTVNSFISSVSLASDSLWWPCSATRYVPSSGSSYTSHLGSSSGVQYCMYVSVLYCYVLSYHEHQEAPANIYHHIVNVYHHIVNVYHHSIIIFYLHIVTVSFHIPIVYDCIAINTYVMLQYFVCEKLWLIQVLGDFILVILGCTFCNPNPFQVTTKVILLAVMPLCGLVVGQCSC